MQKGKSNDIARWSELVLRLALGGFFAWSGWVKVFQTGLNQFTRAVGNYKLVNPPLDAMVAYTVPWVEMTVGACLILGIWKRGVLLVLAGLVGAFAFGVRHAWVNNLNIACGCTGNPDGTPMDYTLKFWEFGGYWVAILLLLLLDRKDRGHVFGGRKMQLPGG